VVFQPVQVTMIRAWEPGAEAPETQRICFTAVLDAQAQPDQAAWLADPAPWPAERHRADAPPRSGDVVHDEDGWGLRLTPGEGIDPEAAVHRLLNHEGGFRPGEVVTLRAPNGVASAWRIVSVG